MSRSTRTLTQLARPILQTRPLTRAQHSLLRQNGQVIIQPVRFRKPPLRSGRVFRFAAQCALTTGLLYFVTGYFVGWEGEEEEDERPRAETSAPSVSVVPQALPDGIEGTQVAEAEQVEELLVNLPDKMPEGAWFIPLWWAQPIPSPPYEKSDPEYQGFVKFQHDTVRRKKIQGKLNFILADILSKNPALVQDLGRPLRFTHFNLEFGFPRAPNPEYHRIGIEIAEDYVALTTRPQSLEQYFQVKQVVLPESIAKAFFSSLKTYGRLQVEKLKGYLNLQTEGEEGKASRIPTHAFNLDKTVRGAKTAGSKKKEHQLDANLDRLSHPKVAQNNTAESTSSSNLDAAGSTTTSPSSAKPAANKTSLESALVSTLLPSLKRSEGDFGTAVESFKKTLAQNWRRDEPFKNGTIILSGKYIVSGSKKSMKLSVKATLHPGTDQIEILSINGTTLFRG